MRRPLPLIVITFILLTALLMPVGIYAFEPSLPRQFYGNVTINGQPAPIGTVIEARGTNVKRGIFENPLTTTQSGVYGLAGASGSKLTVQSLSDNELIESGTQIDFYVNGFLAGPSYPWPADNVEPHTEQWNLTVTISLATVTSLTSSLNPSTSGQAVTFTASVLGQTQYVSAPSGSYSFFDNNVLLGNVQLSGNQSIFSISTLGAGTHSIKAVYSGDTYFQSSQSSLSQTVYVMSGGAVTPAATTTTSTTTPAATTPPTTAPVTTTTTSASPTTTTTPGLTVLNLAQAVDEKGKFLNDFEGRSSDGGARINIAAGTVGTTRNGLPLTQITIQPVADPAGSPSGGNFVIGGQCYALEPGGAQFNPAITLSISYDPAKIPAGQMPFISWWNAETQQWEKLETVSIDTVNHTVTARTTHFTVFAVLANRAPASTSPVTTTTAVTLTSIVTPTASISNPPPSSTAAVSGRSNIGLIIGLVTACVVLGVVIILFLKRKPRKGNPG